MEQNTDQPVEEGRKMQNKPEIIRNIDESDIPCGKLGPTKMDLSSKPAIKLGVVEIAVNGNKTPIKFSEKPKIAKKPVLGGNLRKRIPGKHGRNVCMKLDIVKEPSKSDVQHGKLPKDSQNENHKEHEPSSGIEQEIVEKPESRDAQKEKTGKLSENLGKKPKIAAKPILRDNLQQKKPAKHENFAKSENIYVQNEKPGKHNENPGKNSQISEKSELWDDLRNEEREANFSIKPENGDVHNEKPKKLIENSDKKPEIARKPVLRDNLER
ncbi:hypothetical protein JTB14_018840 [Gonioctena quinquepunctata]|nr:hypothetical protein JTB14_018840 [Gonioctena quinquepunctata]